MHGRHIKPRSTFFRSGDDVTLLYVMDAHLDVCANRWSVLALMVEALAMWLCVLISNEALTAVRCGWTLPVEASPLVVAFVIWVKSLNQTKGHFFNAPVSNAPSQVHPTRGHQFASTEAKILHLRFARHLLNKPGDSDHSRNHVNFNFSRSSEWGYHAVSSVSAPLGLCWSCFTCVWEPLPPLRLRDGMGWDGHRLGVPSC